MQIELTDNQVKNLRIFLSRASLTGNEVEAFTEILAALNHAASKVTFEAAKMQSLRLAKLKGRSRVSPAEFGEPTPGSISVEPPKPPGGNGSKQG